ncbi:hypothetical protein D1B33_04795 [Lysinibacillus yapensis]|uniref:Uncharacterized protein n=1 Tax=Ureibacillus yapensis TaxID=2304605 RepID=A0A396SQ13_9BACL|nr:hypothetical protein [Lysinibacillus yapensis]RHW38209.1 hypothetical protein D1B33_04795 [Lysinibacillus yapensis]
MDNKEARKLIELEATEIKKKIDAYDYKNRLRTITSPNNRDYEDDRKRFIKTMIEEGIDNVRNIAFPNFKDQVRSVKDKILSGYFVHNEPYVFLYYTFYSYVNIDKPVKEASEQYYEEVIEEFVEMSNRYNNIIASLQQGGE